MDEKMKKIIFIVLGGFVLLFLFLFIISSCDKEMSIKNLEKMMVDNAKYYYKNHKEELPQNGNIKTVSLVELESLNIIDELETLEEGTTCSGMLTIENNNDYYLYSPSLNCTSNTETYKTEKLKDVLLKDLTTTGNGLYNINNEYYYRGDNVNNYVVFDGLLWRATKINNNNSIRLLEVTKRESVVWDDRYNSEIKYSSGINDFISNGLNSRIKDTLENIYNTEDVLSNDAKGFIKATNLCVGKRSLEETINDGTVECSSIIENQYIGLLQVNEYLIASLDTNCINTESTACENYNYLAEIQNPFWTITASTTRSDKVYRINGNIIESTASNTGMARMVINISENTNVTGKGTEKDPYIVSGLKSELKK
ncbi:MAG: hypothetical protein IJD92_03420 [Bacilli bacterium]|nr:hypothetical protein [Bacilli bacterium]